MAMGGFETLMECSICLDRFSNPKMLMCGHQYCKDCLEDIMVFNGDGSATLICPMKCAKRTVVGVDETVNDLPTPYAFMSILEASNTEKEQLL